MRPVHLLVAYLVLLLAASTSEKVRASAPQKVESTNEFPQPVSAPIGGPEQPSEVDLRGIYVGGNNIIKENFLSLHAALQVPGVDGLLLNLGWVDVEPARGQFQWDTLDVWMSRAIALGKKVSISVAAGLKTPPWLFQPPPNGGGARRLDFSIARKDGAKGVCLPDTLAVPWDTAFQAEWGSMLTALSTHLKTAGTYDAVVLVRLTGLNLDSDELHQPTETAQSTNLPCVSDAITTWQTAGYRPSLLLKGWDGITTSFQKNFPDKCFSVPIIAVTSAFPPIGEDGLPFKIANHESLSVAQNLPLLMLASQKFPGHLVIQNNSLYVTEPARPQTIHAAQTLGTMIAFQTNEDLPPADDKRAACGGPGDTTVCTAPTYIEMLEHGIYPRGKSDSLRAQYIEVFAANVNAFPQDILQAHLELTAAAPTAVPIVGPALPPVFDLQQNYPNPFNPSTTVRYTLAHRSHVTLTIYNSIGQKVAELINDEKSAGSHEVQFNSSNLASGMYFYRLQAGSFVETKKLVLTR